MDRPREGGLFRDRSLFTDLRRERRTLQPLPEDGIHGAIGRLAEDERPTAGRVQARGAVALGEIEHSLGSPQAVDWLVGEHLGDELADGFAQGLSLFPEADRRHHHPGDLFGRVMQEVGDALAGLLGPRMGGDPFVLVVELDAVASRLEPEDLADEAMRRAVIGFLEDHVAVGVELGLLEDRRLVALRREREQHGLFSQLEAGQGSHVSRAVIAGTSHMKRPVAEVLVGLVDISEDAPSEGVALDVMDAALDLALVLRSRDAAGSDREAVMLRHAAVGALDLGILEAGAGDGRFEIVDDDAADDAAKELPGMDVAGDPGLDTLVEDELGIEMAAVGEDQNEGPGSAHLAAGGIQEAARVAEVDLRLLPRGHLDPHEGLGSGRSLLADEPEHAGVAARKLILVAEDLEDRLGLDSLAMKPQDFVAEALDPGGRAGFWIRELCLEHGVDLGQRRQLASIEPPLGSGKLAILSDGLPMDAQIPGDLSDGTAGLDKPDDLADIEHAFPPAGHGLVSFPCL